MTNEEFIRENYCGGCQVSLYCETNNSFCFTTEAMLKAAEWRENNPDGLVGTLDGFISKNYCVSCGNNCVFFDVNKNCSLTKAILEIIKWKDEEMKRCGEFLGIFFCDTFSSFSTTLSPRFHRGTPPIRGGISSLIGEGDHEVVERLREKYWKMYKSGV